MPSWFGPVRDPPYALSIPELSATYPHRITKGLPVICPQWQASAKSPSSEVRCVLTGWSSQPTNPKKVREGCCVGVGIGLSIWSYSNAGNADTRKPGRDTPRPCRLRRLVRRPHTARVWFPGPESWVIKKRQLASHRSACPYCYRHPRQGNKFFQLVGNWEVFWHWPLAGQRPSCPH
jgi:hypothetical protein